MAKKSFKVGLSSLIQDSRREMDEEEALNPKEQNKLLLVIKELNEELQLWRTGELNTELFHKSLKESKMKYNSSSNSFERI